MSSPLALVAFGLACAAGALEPPARPVFRQPTAAPAARAADLVARMEPEEKLAELGSGLAPLPAGAGQNRETTGRSRHGIPVLFHADLLDATTPAPIAIAASWDPDLAREVGVASAASARARGARIVQVPLALSRDPRLGRLEASFGEDPHLVAEMGVAIIAGVQERSGVLAAAGPFAGPPAPAQGTDVDATPIAERELRELHLHPFEQAVTRAGVRALVAGRNEIDGVPAHANSWLLQDVAREEWRYKGAILAAPGGIGDLHKAYRVAADGAHAGVLALNSGLDGDLGGMDAAALGESIRAGTLAQGRIDAAVERSLALKFEAGLFDPAPASRSDAANTGLAARVARRSIVLLANSGALPLALPAAGQPAHRIALADLAGVGLRETLQSSAGRGRIEVIALAQGAAAPPDATGVVIVAGDDLAAAERRIEALAPGGPPVIVVLAGARPLASVELARRAQAIIGAWSLGRHAAAVVADVLVGRVNPGGKLPVTIARNPGQWPITYDAKPSGRRGYLFDTTDPLYPFGWGLGYSAFEVGAPRLARASIAQGEAVQVTVDVRNTGARPGDETVQVYVRDKVASVTRPVKALRAFKRVTLAPGESRTLTFTLEPRSLALWDERMRRVVEPGEFEILAGPDSSRLKSATLNVEGR